MDEQRTKKLKKFIFSGNSVQYPAGEGEFKPAKSLEWQLIRAALRREPIHWIDGFLIFETWRAGNQKGNYISLFRKVASNVKKQLQKLGINGLEMGHPTGQIDYWMLLSASDTLIESNIFDAIQAGMESCKAFRKSEVSLGWELILCSYQTWPDATALTQAIIHAHALPGKEHECYNSLPKIRDFIVDSKQEIVSALAKVIVLALEEKQGLNEEIVQIAINRWGGLLFYLNTVLELLEGRFQEIAFKEIDVEEFISLANSYSEYIEDSDRKSGNSVEVDLYDHESSQLMRKMIGCDFVRRAAELTMDYFESIDYLRAYASRIDESLETIVSDFMFEFNFPVSRGFNLFPAFCRYLRNYIKRDSIGAGISDIFECDDENESKKSKIASLLQNVADIGGLGNQIEELFEKQSDGSNPNQTIGFAVKAKPPFMTIRERLEQQEGRYPCLEDIEVGNYYRNECYHQEVADILQKNKRCLIVATPGCGKTSLAIALGYEFSQKGISVYYQDAATESDTGKWQEFIQSCDENTLVILDNAHTRANEINNLICRKYDAMLLINSRKVPDSATFTRPPTNTYDISYLSIFRREKAVVEFQINEETIHHIIQQHAGNKAIDLANIGNIDSIIKKSAGDYNILHFYIQAWKNKGYSDTLSDIKEKDVLSYIYNHYLRECPYQEEILKISALTQLEIDADYIWFSKNEKLKDKNKLMQKDGLVLVSEEEPFTNAHVSWLRIYHPTAAQYFLKAASLSSDCHYIHDVDEFSLACLKDYLKSGPFNFFRLFQVLYEHKKNWHEKLIQISDLINSAAKIIQNVSVEYINCNYLSTLSYIKFVSDTKSVTKEWIIKNLFMPRILHTNRSKRESIVSFSLTFQLIKDLGIDGNRLTSKLDFLDLGRTIAKQYVKFKYVYSFIWSAFEARIPHNKIATFCCELNFQELANLTKEEQTHFGQIWGFIHLNQLIGVPENKILEFYEGLNFQELGKMASEETGTFSSITGFIVHGRGVRVSYEKIIEFCGQLNFSELAKLAQRDDWRFNNICFFVDNVRWSGVSRQQIMDFVNGLNFQDLEEQVQKEKDEIAVTNIIAFICHAHWAGVSKNKINSFCKKLNHWELGKKIKHENAALGIITEYIAAIRWAEINDEVIVDFCNGLDFQELGKKLQEKTETVWIFDFIILTRWSGVDVEKISKFILELDFQKLGIAASRNQGIYAKISIFIDSLYWAKTDFHKIMVFYNSLSKSLLGYSALIKATRESGIPHISNSIKYFLYKTSKQELEMMLKNSPYHNIGIFLSSFQNNGELIQTILHDKKMNFAIFTEIFHENMSHWSIGNIGEYLFSFYFINRTDISHNLIAIIDTNIDTIVSKMKSDAMGSIFSFLWNLWIRSRVNEIPKIFYSQDILDILKKRISYKMDCDLEYSLAIIGTYNLIHEKPLFDKIPEYLLANIKEICLRRAREKLPITFPLSANYLQFSIEEKRVMLNSCDSLNLSSQLTNLKVAIERLKAKFLQ